MLLEEQQQRPGELLGQIAIGMGLITDDQLVQALGEQMGMQVVSLYEADIAPDVLTRDYGANGPVVSRHTLEL